MKLSNVFTKTGTEYSCNLVGISEDNDQLKKEIVQALDKNTPKDYLAIALKTGLSNIPIVGGSITELMNDFIPNSKAKRLLDFVAQLKIDVEYVKDRINKDVIKTDEFAYLFEQTFRVVNENYQKEKIDSFRILLVNSLIRTDVNAENKEILFNILKNLSVRHIKFLKMFYDPEKYVKENGCKISPYSQAPIGVLLGEIFPEYNVDEINLILADLHSMGLGGFDQATLGVALRSYGIHLVQNRLKPLGRAVVEFIVLK
jgi:hypothetical protein